MDRRRLHVDERIENAQIRNQKLILDEVRDLVAFPDRHRAIDLDMDIDPERQTAPPGAQELVLVAEDADKGHVHWTVWGLPPQKGKLMEGETPPRTGKNAHGNSEWLLPDPPLGEEHRYVFQLFAIDLPLTLMPGATHEELVRNLDGHVTAAAVLTARFEGHEVEELDVEDLDDVD